MAKTNKLTDMAIMDDKDENIVLFYPNVPPNAHEAIKEVLKTRWIGQGPKVEEFEKQFSNRFGSNRPSVAVGSGTDALHLAYILSGLKPGDEVIAPVFTCTATNIPFLYMGVKIRFADVDPDTLNININDVERLVNEKTKAIVCVHYGGLPCDMDELQQIANKYNIPIIEDAAHALGATYKSKLIGSISEFTMYSFQAIKHITTGDGGMLILSNEELLEKALRIRWFGIDRRAKQGGIWEHDISDIGYKYQMTDISAALGLVALEDFDEKLEYRKKLFSIYEKELSNMDRLKFVGGGLNDRTHAAWLCTVIAENREKLQIKLRDNNIESGQVHFRNDRYDIFKDHIEDCSFPHMDNIEQNYLVLPLHNKVSVENVYKVCEIIRSGW